MTASPAQFSSWNEARSELMIEAKKPLKAQLAGELAVAADEKERESIKAEFDARERILEHELDHTPRELSMVRRTLNTVLAMSLLLSPAPPRNRRSRSTTVRFVPPAAYFPRSLTPPSPSYRFLVEVERRRRRS